MVADLITVKTLTSGDPTPDEGDTVTFQIEVTNDGNVDATNVSLVDLLPPGITLTGSSVTQGTYSDVAVPGAPSFQPSNDPTDTFFNEQQFSFGFGLQNNSSQPITNWAAEITNANYDLDETQLTNNTAFNLTTTMNPDGTYNHLFVGTGTIPPFSGLPGGAIEWNPVNFGFNPTSSGIATGTATTSGGGTPAGLFDIGTLAAGDSAILTLTGTVDVGQGGNTITNVTTAAMGDQDDPSTVGDDLVESVVINDAADLVTVKTLASGDVNPAEGDTVTFDITVRNDGGAQATNVSLTDSLPAGITFTGSATTPGTTYDQATGLLSLIHI